MKKLVSLAIAGMLGVCTPALAETTLVFATATSPQSPLALDVFEDWVEKVNADGKGIVQIDLRHGMTLANPGNHYDRVTDGVVDITWGIMTQVGGQFPRLSVLELPFLTEDISTRTIVPFSLATWRLIESGLVDEEIADIVPLFVSSFPQTTVHLSAPVADYSTLAGAKIVAGGATVTRVVEVLGGVPQSINAADSYEAIQRGTVDGRIMPWSGVPSFRLGEVTSYHIDGPFGSAPGAVYISRASWEALSDEARDVLMRNSGEAQTRVIAEYQIKQSEGARAAAAANPAVTIIEPSREILALWRLNMEPIRAEWIEKTPDGAAVLAKFEELLAIATAE